MTPSTLVPAGGRDVPDYVISARQHLTTVADVDAEIDRCKRFSASAHNAARRAHWQSRLRFLTQLRGEVATPELFAV